MHTHNQYLQTGIFNEKAHRLETLHRFYFGRRQVCIALAMGSDQITTAKSRESVGRSANSNENCCMVSCVKLGGPLAFPASN